VAGTQQRGRIAQFLAWLATITMGLYFTNPYHFKNFLKILQDVSKRTANPTSEKTAITPVTPSTPKLEMVGFAKKPRIFSESTLAGYGTCRHSPRDPAGRS
jgi:hypothetical protein